MYTTLPQESNTVYKLRFLFKDISSQLAVDSIVYAVSVELFLRNIHCVQLDESTLAFDSDSDRSYAILRYSSNPLYSLRVLD